MIDCYYDGFLKTELNGFKDAVLNKNTSAVFVVDGRSGMGKTTLSFQVGNFLDETFSLDKVFWEPEKFLEALKFAKKGDCLIFDEAMILSSRSALSEMNRMIVMAMSMIRSKNLFIIFNVNSIFDLDKNLALSRCDLLLHVYGDNLVDRGNFTAFFKAKGDMDRIKQLYLLGKKMYNYGTPKANFYGRFYTKFILDEKEYEEKKQEGINNFLSNQSGKSRTKKRDMWLKNAIVHMKDKFEMKQEDIADVIGCSQHTISNLLSELNQ